MNAAGYSVKGPTGLPMLFTDKDRATDRAALMRGSVTSLFSLHQVIKAIENSDINAPEVIDFLVELGQE